MAPRLGGKPKAEKKPKRRAAKVPAGAVASGPDDAPGIGHNIRKIRDEAKKFFDRLDNLNDAKEAEVQSYNEDIKEVIEEAAGALGKPQKVVKAVYTEHRREQKRQKWEAELDLAEKASYEELRDAFGADSPLGAFAGEKAKEFEVIDDGATGGTDD